MKSLFILLVLITISLSSSTSFNQTNLECPKYCWPDPASPIICNECLDIMKIASNTMCSWIPGVSYFKCLGYLRGGRVRVAAMCALIVGILKAPVSKICKDGFCVPQKLTNLVCSKFTCICPPTKI